MTQLHEAQISRAILASYSRKLDEHLISDVLIVGAGPAGLTAAYHLAGQGLKVAMIEKRLAPGGGIWGGAMGMNQVVIQEEALTVLRDLDVRHHAASEGLYVVDATELACALCLRALRSGAAMFNLVTVEDISIHENAVTEIGRAHV